MSTNNTTPAAESDDVVLSGGVLFIIIFFATSVFFFTIMTVVCLGEFKEYRTRRRRTSGPILNGNYPRQPPLAVPPVTNPTIAGADYPRQPTAESFSQKDTAESDAAHNNEAYHSKDASESVIANQGNASDANTDIVVLHDTPRKKHTPLQPLELNKAGTAKHSNLETIFSPRTMIECTTTVAFTPPLPSISSNISQSDITPIVSS